MAECSEWISNGKYVVPYGSNKTISLHRGCIVVVCSCFVGCAECVSTTCSRKGIQVHPESLNSKSPSRTSTTRGSTCRTLETLGVPPFCMTSTGSVQPCRCLDFVIIMIIIIIKIKKIIIIIIMPGQCLWCCHRDLQPLREFTQCWLEQ